MNQASLTGIVSNPRSAHRCTVVWLHGLGASGHDFEPIVPELGIQDDLGIRFVFPHAPEQPVTINGGYVMRSWYDIKEMDLMQRADEGGIRASQALVERLLKQEIELGIPPERIVLAGFSQGGLIALETGLRFESPLAGVMALSTYLPLRDQFPSAAESGNGGVPVFYGHGDMDPVIPIEHAESSRRFLQQAGYTVEWHQYLMEHSVSVQEIRHIKDWLSRVLAA